MHGCQEFFVYVCYRGIVENTATKARNGERSGTKRQCVNKESYQLASRLCELLEENRSCSSANSDSSCCTVWILLSDITSAVSCKLSIFKAAFGKELACTSFCWLGQQGEIKHGCVLVAPCLRGDVWWPVWKMELHWGQHFRGAVSSSCKASPGRLLGFLPLREGEKGIWWGGEGMKGARRSTGPTECFERCSWS